MTESFALSGQDLIRLSETVRRQEETPYLQQAGNARKPTEIKVFSGMRCRCSLTIPANSVAMITGLYGTGRGVYTVKRPDEDNATELVFIPKEIPANTTGICFAPYDTSRQNRITFIGSPAVGDTVGTTNGTWTLHTGKIGFTCQAQLDGIGYARPFSSAAVQDFTESLNESFPVVGTPGSYQYTATSSWITLQNSTMLQTAGNFFLGFLDLELGVTESVGNITTVQTFLQFGIGSVNQHEQILMSETNTHDSGQAFNFGGATDAYTGVLLAAGKVLTVPAVNQFRFRTLVTADNANPSGTITYQGGGGTFKYRVINL